MRNAIMLVVVVLLLVLMALPAVEARAPVLNCRRCVTCDVLGSDLIGHRCEWGANCKPGAPACMSGQVQIDWSCKCGPRKVGHHDR